MEKIWMKRYQKGVPHDIDINRYQSLVDLYDKSCSDYANRVAFSNLGTELTYQSLREASTQFANFLTQQGLKKGDRVALMLPNVLQYPVCMYGVLQAGMVAVNVNPLYTAKELTHTLNNSGAKLVVILANFAHVLAEALPDIDVKKIVVTQIGDLFPQPKRWLVNAVVKYVKHMVPHYELPNAIELRDALQQGDNEKKFTLPQLTHADPAFLQYTGGTTGLAKGAILSHGNIIANVLQLEAWVKPLENAAPQEIIITALPLYHIFSLTVNCLTYTILGGHNVLITNPRDIPHFIGEMKKVKFTAISGVNTLYNAMMNHPKFNTIDFSNMHFSIAGGMALQQSVADRWQRLTGVPMVEGYGLTEASPVVTANPLDIQAFTGSIGLPLPATDISIRDDQNNELPLGKEGELCVKGPQVMSGYWNSPDETKKAFTADGWLRTGDIARIDEKGFVFIVDRKKDMIIVSGFNVYPNEVEDVIASHPDVLEVAVVGVPDDNSGEKVKAFIVKKGNGLTKDDIISFCRESLTRYKVPKEIEFRDELPKSNVGKILRRKLRE